MSTYYNEIDPKKAAWLRELIARNLIAPGEVDERSIVDVRADDLVRFTQCHFFAGIGVWSYALRRAGWSDDRPVWTGSCPCQPFSVAGARAGADDERHLWPEWSRLIGECVPPELFGEQVASKPGLAWLDLVHADLEGAGYAVGTADLCAASVGAPHRRQRLYFVADSSGARRERNGLQPIYRGGEGIRPDERAPRPCAVGGDFHAGEPRLEGLAGDGNERNRFRWLDTESARSAAAAGATRGFWGGADWWLGRDGKARPIEPGLFPLAHGSPARVVRLRGYGDGLVAPLAEAFIRAYLDLNQ